MIDFKELFEGSIDSKLDKKNYIYNYQDKYIIRTNHTKDRFDDSNRAVTKKKKLQLFKKAIKYCQIEGRGGQVYVFFVKLTNVGMVIDYREDKKGKVEGNNLIMVTWIGDVTQLPISKTMLTFKLKYKNDIRKILEQIGADLKNVKFVEL